MQRAKASGVTVCADVPAFGLAPDPVDDELPPHAAVSAAAAAMTVMRPATRARRNGQGECMFMATSLPAVGGGHVTRTR